MAGLVNENIVFPVLDLIKRELDKFRKENNMEGNPLDGYPSVKLFREGADPDQLTGVLLTYDSGWTQDITLIYGGLEGDVGTVTASYEQLAAVIIETYHEDGTLILTYSISLIYDSEGRLTETEVVRID